MLPQTYTKLTATQHSRNFREAAQIQEVPLQMPEPGEILIKNHYAGVNAADLMMAAGMYLVPTPVPCDLGAEAVGQVVAVGEGVTQFKEGDFALTNAIGAGYCEYYRGKAAYSIPIPAATPEIMSLSIGGLTASIALDVCGRMTSNEKVLVTAAAGGTGQFAVQLAKLAGNHVIGTCGSDEKAELITALGCDRAINYNRENLRDVLKSEYSRGVDIVFEGVGSTTFDAALDNMARFGRLITIGFISEYKDQPETITAPRVYYKLIRRMVTISGFNLNLYFGRPVMIEHTMKLVGLLNEGKLKVAVDPVSFHGVSGAMDAVEYLHSGKNTGKVIVRF